MELLKCSSMTMREQWSSLYNEVSLHPSMQMPFINRSKLRSNDSLNCECIATALSRYFFSDFNACISKPQFPSKANGLLPHFWFMDSSYHYNLLGFSMAILHECLSGCKRTAGSDESMRTAWQWYSIYEFHLHWVYIKNCFLTK